MSRGFVNHDSIVVLNDDECWGWTGHLRSGYPYIGNRRANRVVFEQVHRPLKPNEVVHHICENEQCLNPLHLVAMDREQHRRHHGHHLQLYTKTTRKEVWARRSPEERTAIMEKAWAGRRKSG